MAESAAGGNSILKWAMLGIALIIVGVIVYAILAHKSTTTHTGGGGTSQGGLGSFVSGIFGGAGTWLGNLFGPKDATSTYCKEHPEDIVNCNASGDCYNGCLSSRPGYDCSGKPSTYC